VLAEIVVVPAATDTASPSLPAELLIAATVGSVELQLTELVKSPWLLSAKVPIAPNWSAVVNGIDRLAGSTRIETKVPNLTVNCVEALTAPAVAEIVVVPTANALANARLLIVATAALEEFQATEVVKSPVMPFVKVPMTLNCWFAPSEMEGLRGVNAKDAKTGWVTVRMVEPLTDPKEAVIVVVPSARPVVASSPWPPVELLIAATDGLEEFQATEEVKSWVAPFVKAPMALNCWFAPSGTKGLEGVTAKDAKTGAVTVRVVELLTDPKEAVIVVVPWAKLVASPWLPVELLIAATAGLEEFQATESVKFWVAPSVKVPKAINCWFKPSGMKRS